MTPTQSQNPNRGRAPWLVVWLAVRVAARVAARLALRVVVMPVLARVPVRMVVLPVVMLLVLAGPSLATSASLDHSASEEPLFVVSEDGRFAVSHFALLYEHDLSPLLNVPHRPAIDVAMLDAYGYFPSFDVPVGSEGTPQLAAHPDRSAEPMTEEEKDELIPKSPGINMPLPSASAAVGSLLGGAALLASILTKFF